MKKEYLAELIWEKEAQRRWKQEQATQEEYRDIARAYREMLKQVELKLTRDTRKRAHMSTMAAKVAIENVDPLLSGAEKLMTKVFNLLPACSTICGTDALRALYVTKLKPVDMHKSMLPQVECKQCATVLPKMD